MTKLNEDTLDAGVKVIWKGTMYLTGNRKDNLVELIDKDTNKFERIVDIAEIKLVKGKRKHSKKPNYNRISLKSTEFGKMIMKLAKFKEAVKKGEPAIIIGPDYVVIDKKSYNEKFR